MAGAALVTVLNELLRRVEDGVTVVGVRLKAATGMSAAGLGVALIMMFRWRPAGLLSSYELQLVRTGDDTGSPESVPAPSKGD